MLTLRNPLDRNPTATQGVRTATLIGQPGARTGNQEGGESRRRGRAARAQAGAGAAAAGCQDL